MKVTGRSWVVECVSESDLSSSIYLCLPLSTSVVLYSSETATQNDAVQPCVITVRL